MERRYSVYGQTLVTHEDLDGVLPRSVGNANLQYAVIRDEKPSSWDHAKTIYPCQSRDVDGTPQLTIQQHGQRYRLQIPDAALYDLSPSAIVCYPCPGVLPETLTNTLLSTVFSLWLEGQGVAALHASAIVKDGYAVGLLSHSGNGKSTLAGILVQAGYPLLTDDILPIKDKSDSFFGCPGYPYIRFWPDEAQFFLGHYEGLGQVHPSTTKRWVSIGSGGFGSFCDKPTPLSYLYLPERREPAECGTRIEITPIPPRNAVIELVRYSFAAIVLDAMGLQQRRLDLFARIVQQVPMRRLTYPSGLQYLPAVKNAILDDLR